MIKFEVIVSDKEFVWGDFRIPAGQRALKITFGEEDVRAANDMTSNVFLEGAGAPDEREGVIFIWGTKLAAFERMLRESKRKGNDDG